ncbi:MAG TPA: PAS domain-containing sensor histidine kinase [Clostridia bacterium]|nr:PAS domain-containing sensor histidine kinase [Clostridia bacterium]
MDKDYQKMDRSELIAAIRQLESEKQELEHFKQDLEQQELERKIIHEKLEFSWAGNLGRWEWNRKTGHVLFNPKKVEVLGYEVADFPPTVDAFTNLLHPEDYEPTMENMRRHLYGELPVYEVEYRIKTREGKYKWFYDRGRIVEYNQQGEPLRLTGIVFDITEQKEFEARLSEVNRQLVEANEAKNKVFSIVAHDLRNPFTSIISFIDLLENGDITLTDDEYRYIISELKKITTNTDLLLQNILAWARSQTEGIQVNPQIVELAPLIESVCNLLENQAEGKDIRLEQELNTNVTARVDEQMLHTVLRNLISNAIKFSYPSQSIVIHVEQKKSETLISISDSGVGIEAERINTLFDISSAFSTSGTQQEAGTGLGLRLSNEMVKRNQGLMWVQSIPNQGTVFYISLPR